MFGGNSCGISFSLSVIRQSDLVGVMPLNCVVKSNGKNPLCVFLLLALPFTMMLQCSVVLQYGRDHELANYHPQQLLG